MTAPQTTLDLQTVLIDELKVNAREFERKFDVEKQGNKLVLKIHRDGRGRQVWLGDLWGKANGYVKKLGGAWLKSEGQWEIPVSNMQNSIGFGVVPVVSLLSLPFQVRTWDEDPTLADMAETIKSHGLLEPLVVRPRKDGLYEIVNGERRLKASKLAGLIEVSCVIKPMSDQEAYECQMIENIQRKDLADIEKAHWLKYMLEKFPDQYPTQEALAKRIGKTQQYVSYHLAMLKLPEDFTTRVVKESGQALTEGQARAILEAPPEKREEVVEEIVQRAEKEGKIPSVREIKKIVQPIPTPINCQICSLQTLSPTDYQGRVLCPACYEKALQHPEKEPSEPSEREVTETKPMPQGINTGLVFECPECGFTATHIHYNPNKHTLQKVEITET